MRGPAVPERVRAGVGDGSRDDGLPARAPGQANPVAGGVGSDHDALSRGGEGVCGESRDPLG